MSKRYFVYLTMNNRNTVIYTGITNNLTRRMEEFIRRIVLAARHAEFISASHYSDNQGCTDNGILKQVQNDWL